MGAAAAITGVAGGVANFFQGRKMRREAQSFIDNFEWQELKNPYKDLQVSTLGSDLQREELARQSATSTEALRGGGTRGLIGGLGRVQANANLVNREIAANLDQQQKQIDQMAAQDDTQIRAMTENRQANELAGYGQMLQQGRQQQQMGMGEVMQSAAYAGQLGNNAFMKGTGGGWQQFLGFGGGSNVTPPPTGTVSYQSNMTTPYQGLTNTSTNNQNSFNNFTLGGMNGGNGDLLNAFGQNKSIRGWQQ